MHEGLVEPSVPFGASKVPAPGTSKVRLQDNRLGARILLWAHVPCDRKQEQWRLRWRLHPGGGYTGVRIPMGSPPARVPWRS